MRHIWMIAPLATLAMSAANASTVTLTGNDFDVVYDASAMGLFGTPQLIGDNLVFTPNSFDAQSLNGTGTATTQSTASEIQLVAHPGYQFKNLSVVALGDYLMQGTGTLVSVAGSITATDAARPVTQTIADMVVGTPLNVANGSVQNWSGSALINDSTPTVTPGNNPWLETAGTINVKLWNLLSATTTVPNSQAFIQEKFDSVELIVDPVPVPLPPALVSLLSGVASLGLLSAFRRPRSGSLSR